VTRKFQTKITAS